MIPKKYLAAVVAGLSIAIGAFLASDPFSRERGTAWSSTRLQAPTTTAPTPPRGKVVLPRFAAMRCLACR